LLKTFVVFLIPSAVFEVASMTPLTGFTIKPVRPLNPPLKKPPSPSFSAPLIGSVTSPVIPVKNPLKILFPPLTKPSPT
jgi:hypothetical protein